MDQNRQNFAWINNSRTAWPTKILTLFLSFLNNAFTIFKKDVDFFFERQSEREGGEREGGRVRERGERERKKESKEHAYFG